MLPKHRSECELEPPFQRAYFENQFGEKSIGEQKWKPHIRNALDWPSCQEHSPKGGNGLDWFSSIRCPETGPQKERQHLTVTIERSAWMQKTENLKPNIQAKRSFDYKNTDSEKADCYRIYERSLEETMGRKKKVYNQRNGISQKAPGDKSYHAVEYESGFHYHGSTLPVVSFGGVLKTVPDTFIPLVKLPLSSRKPFHVKEKEKRKAHEINEVKQLDYWKPADPLEIS